MSKQAILCVDDEPIILYSLVNELRSEFGDTFKYEKAQDAKQALELIDHLISNGVKLLLIISDWLMPGIRGDEFLDIVEKKHPHIKAIMITGHANAETREKINHNSSVIAVLEKPWDPVVLKNLIEHCMTEVLS